MKPFVPGITEIKGKRCLIIADSVSHELPASDTVLLEQIEGFNIFCLSEELAEQKAAQYGVPIYGYWQTLYASKQWRPTTGVVAYKHGNGGQYVAADLDEKTATTGEVVDGRAIAAVGESLDQEAIHWLEITTDNITLPHRSAMTMAEKIAVREQKGRAVLATVFFVVCASITGWIVGSWWTDREVERVQAQRETLNMEIETARAAVAELRKTKLATAPDQHEMLNLLEALSWIEGIEIPNSKINDVQLSVPYRSYIDTIYVLAQYDIPYIEQWLPEGRVLVNLQ